MNTKEIKARIRKDSERVDAAVDVAAASLGNGAEALGEQSDAPHDRLRDISRNLLDSAKALTEEAREQARLRPLAVFGVAFVAGLIVARALRR